MRRTLITAMTNLVIIVALYLCLAVVLPGCVTLRPNADCPNPLGPSCQVPVSGPGLYSVRYIDERGQEMTGTMRPDNTGIINICNCREVVSSEPVVDCAPARPSVATLWPPDGRMVDVSIEGIDFGDAPVGLIIEQILQDEPTRTDNDDPCPDAEIREGLHQTTRLRAERSSSGNGRVYTIIFRTDYPGFGLLCRGSVKVCVPLTEADQCIDDGANFDSTACASPGADLSVAISDSPDPVTVDGILTYTISVRNNGRLKATGVTLTDDLLGSQQTLSITPGQGSYTQSGNTITWNIGTLASEAQATIIIVVSPLEAGTITNVASVSANENDRNPLDTDTETTTVNPPAPTSADLSITKIDAQDPVSSDDEIAYTIRVTNNGPGTANNVVVTDTLPSGVQFISASSQCNRLNVPAVECNLGTLAAGASSSVFIRGAPTTAGTITNTAKVKADETDPDEVNNSATETTTVGAPVADLSVTKGDSPDPVVVNEPLIYTITVSNSGPDSATNVVLTDMLPPGLVLGTQTQAGFPPNCSLSPGGDSISCSFVRIVSGSSSTVQIAGRPSAPGTITNTASVTATDSTDPDMSNNSATQSTTVSQPSPTADLSITKTDSPDPAYVNRPLNYTITVTNNGLSTATNVVVTDTLPSNVTVGTQTERGYPNDCVLSPTGNSLTCAYGPLANGQSIVIPITVTPTAAGTITNTAAVTASEVDPDTANNTAVQDTAVNPTPVAADLSVTMTDSPDPVSVGQSFTYTITVRNNGPDAATDVRLIDVLSATLRVIRAQTSQGTFSMVDQALDFRLGILAPGAEATIAIEVSARVAGTIANNAFVNSTVSDPNSANNSASTTTTVNP